jgi:hypothetical protein
MLLRHSGFERGGSADGSSDIEANCPVNGGAALKKPSFLSRRGSDRQPEFERIAPRPYIALLDR